MPSPRRLIERETMTSSNEPTRWERMTPEQKAQAIERQRAYVARNKKKIAARQSAYYRANKERTNETRRERDLRNKYGISSEDYARMLFRQDFRCACCKTSKPGGHGERFSVDHDHATGKVRALLCFRCNTVLGHIEEDSDVLVAVMDYLEKHGKVPYFNGVAEATH